MHLWEIKHDYYCTRSNYLVAPSEIDEYYEKYESWNDYLKTFNQRFISHNLIFRWDWIPPWQLIEEQDCLSVPKDFYDSQFEINNKYKNWSDDDSINESRLELYLILPRKGMYTWKEIMVARKDEPAIKEHLQLHLQYLKSLWLPLE
jgi:hypothetical protein